MSEDQSQSTRRVFLKEVASGTAAIAALGSGIVAKEVVTHLPNIETTKKVLHKQFNLNPSVDV